MIQISAIVPTYNRPRELRLCLEGFAAQSAPREAFEVVVVDDGSEESMEPLVSEYSGVMNVVFRRIANSGPSTARNLAIDAAAGPLLLLYDDDLSPLPDTVSYCLTFHDEHPTEDQVALLWFCPDEPVRHDTLTQALFPRMYPFPAGSANWGYCWSGSLTCKKSIFRFGRFSDRFRALEDMELEIRLRQHLDLQLSFEQRLTGRYTRPLTLEGFLSRSYRFGYYDCLLCRAHPDVWTGRAPSYADGDVVSPTELAGVMAALKQLLTKRPAPGTPLFRMLEGLLSRAEAHARQEGWNAANAGGDPVPPGSVSAFL